MPYTTPSVADFRARFPEFASTGDYPDATIGMLLTEAARTGVGLDWFEPDYQPAILYLTAHMLESWQQFTAAGGASSLGVPKSVTIGNRTVSFDTSGAAGAAQGDFELSSTLYGQLYLRLLKGNVASVYALNALPYAP